MACRRCWLDQHRPVELDIALIRWAEQIGPAAGRLVAEILQRRPHPEQGYRACLGIMRLGRTYGAARLNAACARAVALGSYRYHTVKNILTSGLRRALVRDGAGGRLSRRPPGMRF